jgi:hypothetical protein
MKILGIRWQARLIAKNGKLNDYMESNIAPTIERAA